MPYFLIYPAIITVIILLLLVIYPVVYLLMACFVPLKCKCPDHRNDTVQAIEAQYVGEASVVNVDAEAHYVGDVPEVTAALDHNTQSSFVRPAVVANEV